MVHITPHLGVISLLCSISAASTASVGSAIYTNTTSITSLQSTIGSSSPQSSIIPSSSVSSSLEISSQFSSARQTSQPVSTTQSSHAAGNSTSFVLSSTNAVSNSASSRIGSSFITNIPSSGSASFASSAITALNALPQPSIVTSTVVQSGTTEVIGVLLGANGSPITFAAPTTTITTSSPDLSTSVAAVSNQITGLYADIFAWASDPSPAKATPIINNINGVLGDIAVLLGDLPQGGGGGGGGGGGCGFLGLGCLSKGLGSITNGLSEIAGNLPNTGADAVSAVTGALAGVQADVEELEEDEEEDDSSSTASSASSSSTCTQATTGYDEYVTCTSTSGSAMGTASAGCVTKTVTTSGCDITTTISTTIVDACPLTASSSLSSVLASITAVDFAEAAAAQTIINGIGIPLAFYWGGDDSSISSNGTTSAIASPGSTAISSNLASVTGSSSSLNGPSSTVSSPFTLSAANSTIFTSSKATISSTVSAPPITSCTLSSVTALSTDYTYYTIDYPATIACACNDGWEASVENTVGSDGATTYYCAIGTTFIGVSTQAAPPQITTTTSAAYATGTCDLHIFEASESYNEPLYMQLNITDGDGNLLVSDNFNGAWGETAVAKASDSKLPYDVSVDFLESTQVSSRMVKNGIVKERFVGGPSGTFSVNWEDWKLTIAAGDTKWDDTDTSGMPYCSVGGWDNGNFGDWLNSLLGGYSEIPNRQLDCHWIC